MKFHFQNLMYFKIESSSIRLAVRVLICLILFVTLVPLQSLKAEPAVKISDLSPLLGVLITATVTLAIGVASIVFGYWNGWRIERKKAELKYVSDQLELLYGPLYALTNAGLRAADAYLVRQNNYKNRHFLEESTVTIEKIELYRLWMMEVFMPINLEIEKIIIHRINLIEGNFPIVFGDMLGHVATYKAILKSWNDHPPETGKSWLEIQNQNFADILYPDEFPVYAKEKFEQLKVRQVQLIGTIHHRRGWRRGIFSRILHGWLR